MTIQVTVIGINQIGASIGLALKANPHGFTSVGTDMDLINEQKSLKMGAFDRVQHNIPKAVEEADIVVLCLPVDDIRKTLEILASDLKPGAVVLDTSVLQSTVHKWAVNLLGDDRYIVSFYPNLNPEFLEDREHGLDQAQASLFQKSFFMIGASPDTHPDAVKLASDFSTVLGGKPYFADLNESEGIIALMHHLPQIAASALFSAITAQPGWREGRKIGGTAFLGGLIPLDHLDERKEFGEAVLMNSENTVRVLDAYIESLRSMREMISRQDAEALKKTIEKAVEGKIDWQKKRLTHDWEVVTSPKLPTTGQWLGKLVGLGGRLRDLDKPADKTNK